MEKLGVVLPNLIGSPVMPQPARINTMGDYIMKKVEGFETKKIKDYGITPCDVIFNHVSKPSDYLYCRSINVFDDRWRVNIYSKRYVDDIEGKYISHSYFVHFNTETNALKIVSP